MNKEKILQEELKFGDIIVLHSWEYLSTKFKHEKEYDGKENGNLVSPVGYRIFESEKDLYGKPYRFSKIIDNQYNVIINCIGKREISPEEIDKIIKVGHANYEKYDIQL